MNRAPPSAACPASIVAAEPADQPVHDGQAQPGADLPHAAVALVQHALLEGDGEVGVGQAGAAVAHLDRDRARARGGRPARSARRPGSPAARCRTARPAPGAGGRRRWSSRAAETPAGLEVEQHAAGRAAVGPHAGGAGDQRRRGRRARTRRGSRRRRAGPGRAGRRRAARAASPRRSRTPPTCGGLAGRDHLVGQRFGVAGDRGQRRAQVVRHRQQEVALPLLGLAQRAGEGVDRLADLDDLGRARRPASVTSRLPAASEWAAAAARRSGRASRQATNSPSRAATAPAISRASAIRRSARSFCATASVRRCTSTTAAPSTGRPSTNTVVPSTLRVAETSLPASSVATSPSVTDAADQREAGGDGAVAAHDSAAHVQALQRRAQPGLGQRAGLRLPVATRRR